jgi:hypothetical protein
MSFDFGENCGSSHLTQAKLDERFALFRQRLLGITDTYHQTFLTSQNLTYTDPFKV